MGRIAVYDFTMITQRFKLVLWIDLKRCYLNTESNLGVPAT